ncbi:bucentaur or craniofacial development-domain-containing protein [Xylariomycetidae sp. FL2044]|nr:bucentaur or craniofacial development-domain-containing protein [Xylariomycetidae sp. FL2044]
MSATTNSATLMDEDYASEEDSDFAPDAAPADVASEASDSEDDRDKPAAEPKRKRKEDDAAEDGFENSGDEAIIQKGKKRQKKAKRKDVNPDDDDDGGEGGLIKTRSMRAVEKAERKQHAVTGPVTIDVDDLWAKMTAAPLMPARQDPEQEKENQRPAEAERGEGKAQSENPVKKEPPPMIKIKRTYNFAGKVHTEEKLVPRDSAEAKLYLASQDPKSVDDAAAAGDDEQPKRKPRKAFRSIFEPVLEGLAQRSDLNLGMSLRLQLREEAKGANAKKLNVVEKSRMDWAGFVDKEGIKDELELAGKSKESYTHRQDFLARVDAHREEEARRARIAGRG